MSGLLHLCFIASLVFFFCSCTQRGGAGENALGTFSTGLGMGNGGGNLGPGITSPVGWGDPREPSAPGAPPSSNQNPPAPGPGQGPGNTPPPDAGRFYYPPGLNISPGDAPPGLGRGPKGGWDGGAPDCSVFVNHEDWQAQPAFGSEKGTGTGATYAPFVLKKGEKMFAQVFTANVREGYSARWTTYVPNSTPSASAQLAQLTWILARNGDGGKFRPSKSIVVICEIIDPAGQVATMDAVGVFNPDPD